MIAKDLHLRRRKDGVEVITLASEKENVLPGKRHKDWNEQLRAFVPVRYVKSGRKGYLRGDALETGFIVVGKADPSLRWSARPAIDTADTAAALEDLRERDVKIVKRRILDRTFLPEPFQGKVLDDLKPSPNAQIALEQAIHMILAGT